MRDPIQRRLAVIALAGLAIGCLGLSAYAADRPNILWLSTEDIGPNLGAYGDRYAKTPTLDALAARGILYRNAFTVAPVCAPNRSAIITGMYQTALGTHPMRSGGEGVDRSIKPTLPASVKLLPQLLRDAGYYTTNNQKEDYNFVKPANAWHESSGRAHWNQRPDDRPFFAVFNYTDTHEGSVRSTGPAFAEKTKRLTAADRQDPDAITPPPYHPNTPAVRQQWAHYYELITGLDYWIADHLAALEEAGVADDTIVFFWSDHGAGLPRHKRYVYDSGTRVPLIVYVPERWRHLLENAAPREERTVVSSLDLAPTVLSVTGLPIPSNMHGRAFLGPAKAAPRDYAVSARDRMDERYDLIRSVRDRRYRYIWNGMPDLPPLQFMNTAVKSPIEMELRRLAAENALPAACRWAVADRKASEELYDVTNDPHELNNLASDPAHADTLARMRQLLHTWWDAHPDLGFVPEPELDELDDEVDGRFAVAAYLEARSPGIFESLREIAAVAGAARKGDLSTLIQASRESEPSVRYWATLGLRRIETAASIERLVELTSDASATVRIAAWHGLAAQREDRDEAVLAIAGELAHENEWVRLQAAIALDALDEAARPAIAALEKALGDRHNKYVVRVANRALNELQDTDRSVR